MARRRDAISFFGFLVFWVGGVCEGKAGGGGGLGMVCEAMMVWTKLDGLRV